MIKVSIIIPIYNGSEYISECIQGIQKQTLKEIEILCVDDGSTDDSLNQLMRMQNDDKRVHIYQQENQGAGSARNLALRNAVGEFVCFLDVDDYFLSDTALEELYCNAVEQKVLICGGQLYTDLGNGIKNETVYGNLCENMRHGKMLEYVDYQQDFYFSVFLYSRLLLVEHGIVFPSYRQFEDPPFLAKAMVAAERFYVTDTPFYCYRIGYKKRIYDEQMACDQIRGMIDNLRFSMIKELKKLHWVTYYRIVSSCRRELKALCQEKNGKLMALLHEAEETVCWEWLEEKCRIQERTLTELCNISDEEKNGEDWLFPYNKLKEGSQIVLYGSGKVGRSYHRQLCRDGRVSLCAWVDRNASQFMEIDGIEIVSPECLKGIFFDYIVIAVANMVAALEIMDNLHMIGVVPEKVIWDIGR